MKLLKLLFPVVILFSIAACDNTPDDPVFPKATHLYFSDYSGKQVGVLDVNTPHTFDVIANSTDGLDTVAGIAIDFEGGKVYAVEELKNRVIRFNLDGSGGVEVLFDEADSVDTPTSIALDLAGNTLYWGNSGTGQIKKGSMDGGTASSLWFKGKPVISYSYGLVLDVKNQRLFFSDLDEFAGIWIAKLDGSQAPSPIFLPTVGGLPSTTCRNPSSIFVDTDQALIYWADEGLNTISRGSYSSGASSILFNYEDHVNRADGIALDKGSEKVYWSETATGSHVIARGALDGSGEREIILQDVESYSMALRFEGQ